MQKKLDAILVKLDAILADLNIKTPVDELEDEVKEVAGALIDGNYPCETCTHYEAGVLSPVSCHECHPIDGKASCYKPAPEQPEEDKPEPEATPEHRDWADRAKNAGNRHEWWHANRLWMRAAVACSDDKQAYKYQDYAMKCRGNCTEDNPETVKPLKWMWGTGSEILANSVTRTCGVRYVIDHSPPAWIATFDGNRIAVGSLQDCTNACQEHENR